MSLVVAVTVAAALLAVGAGAAKLIRPSTAAGALAAARLPSSARIVRAGAAIELGCGAAALASGAWPARAALAALYGGLLAFSLRSIRVGSTAPCGCFGAGRAPVGWRHVGLDAVVTVALAASLLTAAYPDDAIGRLGPTLGGLVLCVGAATAALAAALLSRAGSS